MCLIFEFLNKKRLMGVNISQSLIGQLTKYNNISKLMSLVVCLHLNIKSIFSLKYNKSLFFNKK